MLSSCSSEKKSNPDTNKLEQSVKLNLDEYSAHGNPEIQYLFIGMKGREIEYPESHIHQEFESIQKKYAKTEEFDFEDNFISSAFRLEFGSFDADSPNLDYVQGVFPGLDSSHQVLFAFYHFDRLVYKEGMRGFLGRMGYMSPAIWQSFEITGCGEASVRFKLMLDAWLHGEGRADKILRKGGESWNQVWPERGPSIEQIEEIKAFEIWYNEDENKHQIHRKMEKWLVKKHHG